MAAVALTAFSANSALYVTGANVRVGDQTSKWSPESAPECQLVDGYYTFAATGEFTISTVKGPWDGDNSWKSGAYTLDGNWTTNETSATANLKKEYNNIPAAKSGEEVTYKVKEDLSTIEATFSNAEVVEYYFIHGQICGDSKWGTYPLTLKDGNYELTADFVPGEFGIRVATDKEGTQANQTKWIGGAAQISKENTSYEFKEGGNSRNDLTGNFTVVYNPTAQTIIFNGTAVAPQEPDALYLLGTYNNWDPQNPNAMTKDGKKFTIESVEFPAGADSDKAFFGFSSDKGDWNANVNPNRYGPSAQDAPATLDTPLEVVKSENSWAIEPGTYSFTVDFSATPITVTITGKPTPPVPVVPENLYLLTNADKWNTESPSQFTKTEDVFTLNDITMSEEINYFNFSTITGADFDAISAADRYGAATNDETVDPGTPTAVTRYPVNVSAIGCKSFAVPAGIYSFIIDFTGENPVMTITKKEIVVDPTPEALYIIGTFNSWTPDSAVEMTKEEKTFVINQIELTANPGADNDNTYFTFITKTADSFDGLVGTNGYGAPTENAPVQLEVANPLTEYTISSVIDCGNHEWMATAGLYDITVSFEEETPVMIITKSIPEAVETLETVEGEAVYFNLQGAKVANPENGIYIRVANGKATKVMVR